MNIFENYDPVNLIINDLYLGNLDAASNYELLKSLGITHIVRVLNDDYETLCKSCKLSINLNLTSGNVTISNLY